MASMRDLGPGLFLKLQRLGPPGQREYAATLRFNRDDRGAGIQTMGFSWHSITHALHTAAVDAHKVLSNPQFQQLVNQLGPAIPYAGPYVAPAAAVATQLTALADNGDLDKIHPGTGKTVADSFQDPTLKSLANMLADAAAGRSTPAVASALSGRPIILVGGDRGMGCSQPPGMGRGFRGGRRGRGRPQFRPPARRGGGWGWGPWGWAFYPLDGDDVLEGHHHHHRHRSPAAAPSPDAPLPNVEPPPAGTPDDGAPATAPEVLGERYRQAQRAGGPPWSPTYDEAVAAVYGPQSGRFRFSRWPL